MADTSAPGSGKITPVASDQSGKKSSELRQLMSPLRYFLVLINDQIVYKYVAIGHLIYPKVNC